MGWAFKKGLSLIGISPDGLVIQLVVCGAGSGVTSYLSKIYIDNFWANELAAVLGFTLAKGAIFGSDDPKYVAGQMLLVDSTFLLAALSCYFLNVERVVCWNFNCISSLSV